MKSTLLDPQVFSLFVQPGEVVEVRIPKVSGNSPAWTGFARGNVGKMSLRLC